MNWGPLTNVPPQTRQEFERFLQDGFDDLREARKFAAKVVITPGGIILEWMLRMKCGDLLRLFRTIFLKRKRFDDVMGGARIR